MVCVYVCVACVCVACVCGMHSFYDGCFVDFFPPVRNGAFSPAIQSTSLIVILSLPPPRFSCLFFPFVSTSSSFPRVCAYRRASSAFLRFGRQAEVVVTVCFTESVPEVSCSHDDSPEAAVSRRHTGSYTSASTEANTYLFE